MSARRRKSECGCIGKVNDLLHKNGVELVYGTPVFDTKAPRRVQVAIQKRDGVRTAKVKYLTASFCPFCGVAYATGTPGASKTVLT